MKNAFATVSREIRNGVFDADMDDLMTVIRVRRSVIWRSQENQTGSREGIDSAKMCFNLTQTGEEK